MEKKGWDMNTYLKSELAYQKKLIKMLVKYFDKSQQALNQQSYGHTPDWQKVQDIADKIEDDFDLSVYGG